MVQRGAIISLEQEVKKVNANRQWVADAQQELLRGNVNKCRELLSEGLMRWPLT